MATDANDPPQDDAAFEEDDDGAPLNPTHRLRNIKAGDNSVQLLISTKDHVYDADGVEAGTGAWQVIGGWDESALGELSKCLTARQRTGQRGGSQGEPQGGSGPRGGGFASRYGGGQKLGDE